MDTIVLKFWSTDESPMMHQPPTSMAQVVKETGPKGIPSREGEPAFQST